MRVAVQVRHFLTPAGRRAFGRVIREHHRLASARPGFIALRRLTPANPARPGEVDVVVEFESLRRLMEWRRSPGHDRIAAAYARCWSRPPEARFFHVMDF